jgi:hypothetical protein
MLNHGLAEQFAFPRWKDHHIPLSDVAHSLFTVRACSIQCHSHCRTSQTSASICSNIILIQLSNLNSTSHYFLILPNSGWPAATHWSIWSAKLKVVSNTLQTVGRGVGPKSLPQGTKQVQCLKIPRQAAALFHFWDGYQRGICCTLLQWLMTLSLRFPRLFHKQGAGALSACMSKPHVDF